jgi:SNF2 family DNA or RNA helicase
MDREKIMQDVQRLHGMLEKMQQMLVSSRLAENGAKQLRENPEEIAEAAMTETGALAALLARLRCLQAEGHDRIVVAANHVIIMKIAMQYLQHNDPSLGRFFLYDGSLSLDKRNVERMEFLSAERAVLFLSICAGGTGLHLVPNKEAPIGGFCRAMVFWGARPFGPQQVWQTLKRTHRIGQKHPVVVNHIIAPGSVDDAIEKLHKDKSNLDAAIRTDAGWHGRILDSCLPVGADGNFIDDLGARA